MHGLLQRLRNWRRFTPIYAALWWAERQAKRTPIRRAPQPWQPGIAILIPESGTPDLLADTLHHAMLALSKIEEPSELIVMVNGAPLSDYAALRATYPGVRWLHEAQALGFNGAIERGLRAVTKASVYLLNSDMRLHADAIVHLLPHREPDVFALVSQIFFADSTRRREETGWSDYYVEGARTVVYERDPGDTTVARGSFYAGGGSALFRTELLRDYVRDSRGYNPFYWEDADWGVRAWAEGLTCRFVPASQAVHEHRGTIKRRFSAETIDRIVDRNALLFELRHHFTELTGKRAIIHLSAQSEATQRELCTWRNAIGIARMRAQNDAVKQTGFRFDDITRRAYFPRRPGQRPRVLWVTPFAILPPSHGGARRILELAKRLAEPVDLFLLSDEAKQYESVALEGLSAFTRIHLVQARQDQAGQGEQTLPERMQAHAPARLRDAMHEMIHVLKPDLVQIEFMEASLLANSKPAGPKYIAALHDVYLDGGTNDAMQRQALAAFDHVISCSEEDATWLHDLPHQVIGNGAPDRTKQMPASPHTPRILFMGPFRYGPNVEGILAFLKHVWPKVRAAIGDAELRILGGPEAARAAFQKPEFQAPGVTLVQQFVDPEVELRNCALSINPQMSIRGSALKVAESLLANRVCVSTQAGARGFLAYAGKTLQVANDWAQMAEILIRLLSDHAYRQQLEQTEDCARLALSWEGKAAELLARYQTLVPSAFAKVAAQ